MKFSRRNDDKNGVQSMLGQSHYEMCSNCEISHKGQCGPYSAVFPIARFAPRGSPFSISFVLCAEGLSSLLHEAERRGRLTGFKICQIAPSVSHHFFTDDSMIMLNAKQEEVMDLREILDQCENCSGQCINLEKSVLLF